MSGRRLILASGSAARQRMLKSAGLMFEVVPADLDEDRVRSGLAESASHREIAVALAGAKAMSVAALNSEAVVIGSDQVLSTGDQMLSKPRSRDDARDTLRMLRGRSHDLHSGVAVAMDSSLVWQAVDTATLTMRSLSDAEIERYLDAVGDRVFGCVGAYQIEGLGIGLFDRVSGDHFTIMGMPLLPLLAQLRHLEIGTP